MKEEAYGRYSCSQEQIQAIERLFGADFLNSMYELERIITREDVNANEESYNSLDALDNLWKALKDISSSAGATTPQEFSQNPAIQAIALAASDLEQILKLTNFWYKAAKYMSEITGSIIFGCIGGLLLSFVSAGGAIPVFLAMTGLLIGVTVGYMTARSFNHRLSPTIAKADHSNNVYTTILEKAPTVFAAAQRRNRKNQPEPTTETRTNAVACTV
jgi:hypothetical protein